MIVFNFCISHKPSPEYEKYYLTTVTVPVPVDSAKEIFQTIRPLAELLAEPSNPSIVFSAKRRFGQCFGQKSKYGNVINYHFLMCKYVV